jgi:hypothetical protein
LEDTTKSVDVNVTALSVEAAMQWQATKRGKVIPTPEECEQIMSQTHALGHFSTETMFRQIWKQGFWWPGIRMHLKKLVQSCLQCLKQDVKHEGFHPARSISAEDVWDHVEMDLIGPLPTSTSGKCWVMTLVDVCSRYTLLRALASKEMEEVAQVLWQVICEYGTMRILQSDNGAEFVNQVLRAMTTLYGIDHRLITAYNPRADVLVEGKNKQVGRII